MRRGGPQDRPGGWSFKTYVRAQKLRVEAELWLSLKRHINPQEAVNKHVNWKFFRKNLMREFFQAGVSRQGRIQAQRDDRVPRRGVVLDKLIQKSERRGWIFDVVEAAK